MKRLTLVLALLLAALSFGQVNTLTLRDGYSKTYPLFVTTDSNGAVSIVETSRSFELAVSMGQVPGYSTLDKFGSNPTITTSTDPEDIWEGGGLYNYDADSTAPIVSIGSKNAADSQLVSVQGLDSLGNLVEQEVTLQGTTRVALDSALWRVFRIQNEGVTDFVGDVYVYTGTDTVPVVGDSVVRAVIRNGNNQTLMALYTVPRGKVGFLYRGEVGVLWNGGSGPAGAEYAKGYYKSRRYGKVFKIKKEISLITTGSTVFQDSRSFPDPVPSLTDIRLQVAEVSETMGAWGTFDMLLVDEELFPVSYLQAIGQPGY